MIDERTAGMIVEKKFPQYKAVGAMKMGTGFVVACAKNNGEELNDCFYALTGDGKNISEFSPCMCPEQFNKALPNAVKL